jgi:hypothetical protein
MAENSNRKEWPPRMAASFMSSGRAMSSFGTFATCRLHRAMFA